jgi:hypothetical protein
MAAFINRKQTDASIILLFGAVASSVNNLPLFTEFQRTVSPIVMVLLSGVLIYVGISQHLEFKRLEDELERLRSQP